jgi:hypothetical protein
VAKETCGPAEVLVSERCCAIISETMPPPPDSRIDEVVGRGIPNAESCFGVVGATTTEGSMLYERFLW